MYRDNGWADALYYIQFYPDLQYGYSITFSPSPEGVVPDTG
jgi:hypothetical protein